MRDFFEDSEAILPLGSSAASSKPSTRSESESVVIRLFDQLQARVLHYVVTCGLPVADAEDVVQETFLSLFRHLELGRPRLNLDGWLFRVAHNLALKRRSGQVRRSGLESEDALAKEPAMGLNPEAEFAFSERHKQLRAVFQALPKQEQLCLQLRAEGLKYRQIADVLGVSPGTVSTLLSRALARTMRATGE